ncbi:MAG TPA: glycosyltransferase WbuB [Arcobacter sp.]|nr:glycosyltransferase WbuB [Arcobacter sp.]
MKTINFLTSHFVPENTACTNRVLAFIRELEKNYKINVICLTQKGKIQENSKVAYSENIDIYYVNQKNFDGKNFFKRAFNELFYIRKLVKISKKIDYDLIMVTSPYMFMIPIVGFTLRGPKILDIRDLVWEYLDDRNIIKRMIKNTLKFIMLQGIRRFDHITVTNDYEATLLRDGYSVKNIDILFNGIEKSRFDQLIKIGLKEDTYFTVTYVGNIGLAQNLQTIIDAAKRLPEVKFLLIGDGIELQDLKDYAERHQINNVNFAGKVAWHMLQGYYEKTSVLYAQLDEKYISAVPSKLYEYASIGLPIIYGGIGQAVKFVEKLENSIVVTPGDVEDLVDAIKEIKEKNVTISKKNRILVKERYLRETAAEEIVNIVNEVIR